MNARLRELWQLYAAAWQRYQPTLRRCAALTRLDQVGAQLTVVAPLLWAASLASGGLPLPGSLLLLLLVMLLGVAAVAVFNDWMESQLLKVAPSSMVAQGETSGREARRVFIALLAFYLGALLWLGWHSLIWGSLALALGLAYPLIKRRLFVVQGYLAMTAALSVPLTYGAYGGWPDAVGWLAYCAAVLWLTGVACQYALQRREYEEMVGIRSLAQLVGESTAALAVGLQLAALFTLWLVELHAELGILYRLGLLAALWLAGRQALLLLRGGDSGLSQAIALNSRFGAVVWLAFLLDALT